MPVSLQYDCKKVHIANEVLADHVCLALFGCNFIPTFVKVNFYPTFIPTEYLWKQHADKGKTKWEIYAWALRDMMCKHTGLKSNDQTYAEQIQYFKYLNGLVDTYVIDKTPRERLMDNLITVP